MGRFGEIFRRAVAGSAGVAIFVAYLHCLVGHVPVGVSAMPPPGAPQTVGSVHEYAGAQQSGAQQSGAQQSGAQQSGSPQSTCHNESGCICRGATLTAPVLPPDLADSGIWLDAVDGSIAGRSQAATSSFTFDQMRLSLAGDPAHGASRPWRSWHPVYRL